MKKQPQDSFVLYIQYIFKLQISKGLLNSLFFCNLVTEIRNLGCADLK